MAIEGWPAELVARSLPVGERGRNGCRLDSGSHRKWQPELTGDGWSRPSAIVGGGNQSWPMGVIGGSSRI